MPNCAVVTCSSSEKDSKATGISFHRFPRDEALNKMWLDFCKRPDTLKTENARIRVCSIHFEKDDYLRDFKAELLNLKPRKILKESAVPKLFSPHSGPAEKPTKKQRSAPIDLEIQEYLNNEDDYASLQLDKEPNENRDTDLEKVPLEEQILELRKLNIYLKVLVKNQKIDIKLLRRDNHKLNHTITKFEKIFSKSQMKFVEKAKCASWSEEDVEKAVTLRRMSKKAFNYIRETLHYPLPCYATIKRYWRKAREAASGSVKDNGETIDESSAVFFPIKQEVVFPSEGNGDESQAQPIEHRPQTLRSSSRFTCHVCLKRLNDNQELKKHLRVHEGNYSCYLCGINFFRHNSLKYHYLTHTGGDCDESDYDSSESETDDMNETHTMITETDDVNETPETDDVNETQTMMTDTVDLVTDSEDDVPTYDETQDCKQDFSLGIKQEIVVNDVNFEVSECFDSVKKEINYDGVGGQDSLCYNSQQMGDVNSQGVDTRLDQVDDKSEVLASYRKRRRDDEFSA